MDIEARLHYLDYIVIALLTFGTLAIGIYFATNRKTQASASDYFTGNRNFGLLSTAVSICVSILSLGMIGLSPELYLYGGQYLINIFAVLIATGVAAYSVVPVLYPLRLISVNKYIEKRYRSRGLKLMCTFCNIMAGATFAGMVTYAPAVVISIFTGWPIWMIMISESTVALVVTTIGGIKAVIWSDVLLSICMVTGSAIIIFRAITIVGMDDIWDIVRDGGRLDLFDFRPDPTIRYSTWSFLLGADVFYFCIFGVRQLSFQRYTSLKNLKTAQWGVFASGVIYATFLSIVVVSGLAIYGYYAFIGCDPLSSGKLSSPNQLVAYFVLDVLNIPGVQGLFIASIAAGSLTTVSSVWNSLAANTWADFVSEVLPNLSDDRARLLCKLLVIFYGIISTGIAFLATYVGGTISQLSRSLNSIFDIPVACIFIAGIYCPWINRKGILAGITSSFATIVWITIGQYYSAIYRRERLPTITTNCSLKYDNDTLILASPELSTNATASDGYIETPSRSVLESFYSISYMYYSTLSLVIFLVVGTIVSFITGRATRADVDERLLARCFRKSRFSKKEETDIMLVSEKKLEL